MCVSVIWSKEYARCIRFEKQMWRTALLNTVLIIKIYNSCLRINPVQSKDHLQ